MGKSSKAKQAVAEYYMSIHLGLSHGPADAITGLFVGEKLSWVGEHVGSGNIAVNAPNLFGGPKSQGGVGGIMTVLNGDDNQVLPAALASRLGGTPSSVPAFRGVCSVFFTGYANAAAGSIDVSGGGGAIGGDGVGGQQTDQTSIPGNPSSGGGSVNPRTPGRQNQS